MESQPQNPEFRNNPESFHPMACGCFTLIVFLLLLGCVCSVFLPHGAIGWSVVCDCGIFWSYLF